jgi:hypothetical protein
MALAHPPPLSPSRRALATSPGKRRQRPLTALAHLIRFTTAGLPAEDHAVRVALRNQSDHGFTLAFSCPACGPDSSVRFDATSNCSARGVFKWHVAEYLHRGVAEAAIQSSVPWETMPVACGGGGSGGSGSSSEGGTCIVDVDDLLPGTLYHCQVQFEDATGHPLAHSELIEVRTSAAMPPPLGAPLVVAVSWDAVDVTIDAGAMGDVLAPMDHHRPSSGGRRRATGSAHQSRPASAASRTEPLSPSSRATDTRTPVNHSDVWSRAVACPPSAARDRVQVVIADSFTAILATPPPTVAEANGKHIAGTQQDGSHAPRFVTWWYPSAVAPARAHMPNDFTVRLSGMAEEGMYVCSTRRVTADALVSEWSPPVSVRTKLMPPPTPRLRVDTSSSTFTTHATTLAVECQGPVPLGLSLVTTVFDLTDQASDELRREAFTRDLAAFYGTHNPDKVNSVAQVAARYRGEEAALFAELERRYETRSMNRRGVSLSARWRELSEETDGPERLWVFNATVESAERRGVVHRTYTTPLARSDSADATQRTLEQAVRFHDLPACATLGLIHIVTNREGRKSEPTVLVTRLPPPRPPADYAVSAVTARSVNLRWSGLLVGNAAVGRYTLWRRSSCDTSDGAWTDWVQVRGAAVEPQHDATVTASIGGLEPNTRYQICATVAVGRGDVNEPPSATATSAEVRTATAAPSNLRGFAAVIDEDAGEHQLYVMFTSNDNGVPPVTAELAVALLDASHVPFTMTGMPVASSAEPDGGAETSSEFAPVAPGKFASDAVPIALWAPSAPHSAACTVKVLWADLLEAFDGSDTCKALLRRALAARRAENSERMATSAQWLRAPPRRRSRSALSTPADLPLAVCATAVKGLHLRLRVAIRLSCARAGATPVAYGTVDVEC